MRTITDTTTARTASVPRGTGADTTVRSTVHITAHTTAATGTVGDITIRGAATDITATATLGITAVSTTHGTMTHGITAVIGADTTATTMADITDGMTHGTTTTTDGTTLTTAARHTSSEVLISSRAITDFAHTQSARKSLPATHQDLQCAHQAVLSGAA